MAEAELATYDDEPIEDTSVEPQEVEETEEQEGEVEAKESKPKDEDNWRPEFDERTQKFIDERIVGTKVRRIREIESELEETRKQLESIRQQVPQDANAEPVIPPIPDPWDADYEKKLQARDEAIVSKVEWERGKREREWQEQQKQLEQQNTLVSEIKTKVETYSKRADDLDIPRKDLEMAGQTIAGIGIPADVVTYILDHDSGPLISLYLAQNIGELDEIRRMNPMRAAAHIEKSILPRAVKKKPAPPPPPTETVRGSTAGRDPAFKGAVFD